MKQTHELTTITLVRHGETTWNAEKRWQGHLDSPLTAEGRQQAASLATRLSAVPFVAVYSSDLSRAVSTAEILNADRQLAIRLSAALRERYAGCIEGTTPQERTQQQLQQLLEKYFALPTDKKWTHSPVPGWESHHALMTRVLNELRAIAVAHKGQHVLVVSHSGVLRTLLAHLGWVSTEQMEKLAISNGGFIMLQSDGIDFFIRDVEGITKPM